MNPSRVSGAIWVTWSLSIFRPYKVLVNSSPLWFVHQQSRATTNATTDNHLLYTETIQLLLWVQHSLLTVSDTLLNCSTADFCPLFIYSYHYISMYAVIHTFTQCTNKVGPGIYDVCYSMHICVPIQWTKRQRPPMGAGLHMCGLLGGHGRHICDLMVCKG